MMGGSNKLARERHIRVLFSRKGDFLFLFAFLTFTLMSATCEPDPIEEECLCCDGVSAFRK
jgi:hypothetical protein